MSKTVELRFVPGDEVWAVMRVEIEEDDRCAACNRGRKRIRCEYSVQQGVIRKVHAELYHEAPDRNLYTYWVHFPNLRRGCHCDRVFDSHVVAQTYFTERNWPQWPE